MFRNLVVVLCVIVVSSGYLWISPAFVPDVYALLVNFVAVPFLWGLLLGYSLTNGLALKCILALLIPLAHVLIFGGDPAKPGLENVLAAAEFVPLCIGCLVGHFFLRKKTESRPAQMPGNSA